MGGRDETNEGNNDNGGTKVSCLCCGFHRDCEYTYIYIDVYVY